MKGTLFKKLVAGALALLMVGTALPQGSDLTGIFGGSEITASAETVGGTCGKNANWSFDTETGKLTITGEGEMENNPWRSYSSYITSVEIANGITSICDNAFQNCDSLDGVVIPDSVNSIHGFAFGNCSTLKQVTFLGSVVSIGFLAFQNCKALEQVTIPGSVKTIEQGAFENCVSLEQVNISEGVETIGKEAFKWCSSLDFVTIPRSVKTIRDSAFEGCSSLNQVTISEGVETIGKEAFKGCSRLASVTIPSSVKTIAGDAFRGCTNLTSIYMLCDPSTLTWNFTDGRYLVRSEINAEDEKIKVYYPYISSYIISYMNLSKNNPITDAQFIPAYNVSVDSEIAHGSVSIRPLAAQGDTVTLTLTPDKGYAVKSVSVNDGDVALTDNGDGTYSFTMPAGDANVTAEMKPFDVHLYGHSISLDGDIGVNFYMELDETILSSQTAYMQFDVPDGKKTETRIVYVKDVLDDTVTISGRTYFKFKCQVAAKDMAAEIVAQLHDGNARGEEYKYSVREYAKYILDHSDNYNEKTINLVKAMLNYGSAAQEYFLNESGSDLANFDLDTDYNKVDDVTAETIGKPYDATKTSLPKDVTFEGVTLSLRSETTLSFYFKGDTDLSSVLGDDFPIETTPDGYQVYRIRGISASKLDKDFAIDKAEADCCLSYCPLTYCYNVLNRNEGTPQLQKVCKALFLYNQAANDYFDKTGA
ncbi:MAG: leucine-rich repeat domain-containing protein [Ruminococcus sp.]|nr:leucine-rich repeat domain-containing protein [Ruminococcus sp.]